MARVTGAQLRAWRQRAGWDVPETARQLRRDRAGPLVRVGA